MVLQRYNRWKHYFQRYNCYPMRFKKLTGLVVILLTAIGILAQKNEVAVRIDRKVINPSTLLWYPTSAAKWEEALPVGNGRLGAMVFGKPGEERIQLNEETYWSGGPYSTVVKGGYKVLPQIQKLVFDGNFLEAHNLF